MQSNKFYFCLKQNIDKVYIFNYRTVLNMTSYPKFETMTLILLSIVDDIKWVFEWVQKPLKIAAIKINQVV